MRKIAIFSIFSIVLSLNALDLDFFENKNKAIFIGGGGGSFGKLPPFISTNTGLARSSQSRLEVEIDKDALLFFQAGYFHYITKYIGLRAYYNFSSLKIENDASFKQAGGNTNALTEVDNDFISRASLHSFNLDLLGKYDFLPFLSAGGFIGIGVEMLSINGGKKEFLTIQTGFQEPTIGFNDISKTGGVINLGILLNFFRFNQLELGAKFPLYNASTTSSFALNQNTAFRDIDIILKPRFYIGYNFLLSF